MSILSIARLKVVCTHFMSNVNSPVSTRCLYCTTLMQSPMDSLTGLNIVIISVGLSEEATVEVLFRVVSQNRLLLELFFSGGSLLVCFRDGDWFRTTVWVRQGCLLSPTLFNIFLERIMADALEDHKSTVCFGGRTISNLRFCWWYRRPGRLGIRVS